MSDSPIKLTSCGGNTSSANRFVDKFWDFSFMGLFKVGGLTCLLIFSSLPHLLLPSLLALVLPGPSTKSRIKPLRTSSLQKRLFQEYFKPNYQASEYLSLAPDQEAKYVFFSIITLSFLKTRPQVVVSNKKLFLSLLL